MNEEKIVLGVTLILLPSISQDYETIKVTELIFLNHLMVEDVN